MMKRTVPVLFTAATLAMGQAVAGGLTLYEVGSADVGLASAGYSARAQDASTVLTNPAGMTRLKGTQVLGAGQLLWSNTEFSRDSGTSPGLGNEDGGYAIGSDGWFPGGGAFLSHSVSSRLKLGVALTGNFGAALEYDDDWVGRYYVQESTLMGVSVLPSIAYKVTDKLSLGASLNAMYGIYENQVAINNIDPRYGDGKLKLDDNEWGWGVNLGLLYEVDSATRLGLTWSSQVDLDFKSSADFSGLAPGISTVLGRRGLLDSKIKVGINVPQQVMLSGFSQVNDRWAVLGSLGWQQWSKFGQVQIGIDNRVNPQSLTIDLGFKDTWHAALGAQYRVSAPWLLNFGVAYDSGFQDGDVTPLLPMDAGWRFGVGGQQQLSKNTYWGISAEYLYGESLDVDEKKDVPVAFGGRGDLSGSYDNISTVIVAAYYNWGF